MLPLAQLQLVKQRCSTMQPFLYLFWGHSFGSQGTKASSGRQWKTVQVDLSLHWVHLQSCSKCCASVQFKCTKQWAVQCVIQFRLITQPTIIMTSYWAFWLSNPFSPVTKASQIEPALRDLSFGLISWTMSRSRELPSNFTCGKSQPDWTGSQRTITTYFGLSSGHLVK